MTLKLKIPDVVFPTDEEHRAISQRWLKRVQPCLIDQWPKELAALSFHTEFVPVDAASLWEEICTVMNGGDIGQLIRSLADELDAKMGWKRHFVRLNSRSPKDFPWPFEAPATMSGKEAMTFLIHSERVTDDLYEFKWAPEQPAFICLREWQYGLRSTEEYRCFVKDGELIAVTAYDYTKPQMVPADGGKAMRETIDAYFRDVLKPTLHIDTVVFDLWMPRDHQAKLIEINPWGLSDPCFFGSYHGVENASSFIQYEQVLPS